MCVFLYLFAGGARAFLLQPTPVDQVPGVQSQGFGVRQQHLRLTVGVSGLHVGLGEEEKGGG